MAIGDVLNPKRARTQGNERLDTVDADALAVAPREHLDAYARGVEATPRNVGGSTPVGLIFQGFGLTLNPTSPSDSKVRVQSALGVAFDANGRLLIKEAGVQVDLTLSAGNSQIYAYFIDTAGDAAVRRAITVTPPYTDIPLSMATKLKGGVAFYVRSGDQTSIVASDVVNGATTALCFLGVASVSGGVVTVTGYDPVTAPNGTFVTNRLTTVAQPSTLPASSSAGGSVATMHGLVNAALYMIGQVLWKGSTNLTPSASNNFGAFSSPTVGIDALFDSQGELLFGSVTRWRDWLHATRFLIDHQGFPGGQISVKDEFWFVHSVPENVNPTSGFAQAISGNPAIGSAGSPLGVDFGLANGGSWIVPLSVPVGSLITSVIIWYASFDATNTFSVSLNAINLASGVDTVRVSKAITTSPTGLASTDLMVSPVSGHGPKISTTSEQLKLVLTATHINTGAIVIYMIQTTRTTLPTGWSYVGNTTDLIANGDAVVFSDPVSGLNHRHVQVITAASASVVGMSAITGDNEVYVDADLNHTMEFMVKTGTITDSFNTLLFSVLMRQQGGSHWGLERRSGDTHWQLKMSDPGADQWVDTGVVFSSNTVYRIKIDFQGANRNSSALPRARLWINGTLVATVTSSSGLFSFPPAAAGPVIQALAQNLTSGPYDVRVGRLHRAWNHVASGDNV